MKSLTLIICLSFLSSQLLAQTTNKTIAGHVKDIQNEAVAGATIRLLKAYDSTVVQTKTARDNGKFEFTNLANGTFLLAITAVGNKKYYSTSFTIDDKQAGILLPVIILLPEKKIDLKESFAKFYNLSISSCVEIHWYFTRMEEAMLIKLVNYEFKYYRYYHAGCN